MGLCSLVSFEGRGGKGREGGREEWRGGERHGQNLHLLLFVQSEAAPLLSIDVFIYFTNLRTYLSISSPFSLPSLSPSLPPPQKARPSKKPPTAKSKKKSAPPPSTPSVSSVCTATPIATTGDKPSVPSI